MAKILFGGPQEKERGEGSPEHNDLLARLRKNHEVDYIVRGDDMMGALTENPIEANLRAVRGVEPLKPYKLVIYDTQLFYDLASPQQRADIFRSKVIDWLKIPQAPVIVLADEQVASQIEKTTSQAGFKQINKPYDVKIVVEAVNQILG